tara:strand:+ start:422 stop:811 length:390 start_codon:yes stop_codon:yes gene_type:complete
MIKKYVTKENVSFAFGFIWFFYSCLVFAFESCSLYMEKTEEGKWDIVYYITESDETGNSYEYKKLYEESLNLNEAHEIINDCINESDLKMKKYGSVYNLKTGNSFIDLLIKLSFFIIPFYLIYKLHIKK